MRFATRSATANSFLTGGIDEVAIYPRVLTPERIKRHYDVAAVRPDTEMVKRVENRGL